MTISRPMLAETLEDVNALNYPIICSPKLDGIRCMKVGGKALSRKFKPIPNHYVRNWIEANLPDGIDGELMVKGCNFNEVQSAIMSEAGEPDFEFWAFDHVEKTLAEPFSVRYDRVRFFEQHLPAQFIAVPHVTVHTVEELLAFEAECLAADYEGVMIRCPDGHYKCGRSTLKQGWLLKLKRFADSEAIVLGLDELQTNTNAKEVNELGLSKRSSKKAGKVGANTLGRFRVRDVVTGIEFEIGTGEGLTQELRKEIWENQDKYLGKLVKYKYQASGMKEGADAKPRFPVWLAFRDERDMGDAEYLHAGCLNYPNCDMSGCGPKEETNSVGDE